MPLKAPPKTILKSPSTDQVKRPIEGILKIAFGVTAINVLAGFAS